MKHKSVFNWSGGKDSAHALLRAIESEKYDIVALLTTINRDTKHSTMHRIPLALLEAQAKSIGIPLYIVDLVPNGGMDEYSNSMFNAVTHFKEQGVTHFIFGDIFLEDIKKYREEQLAPCGIEVVEPLWDKSSKVVMDEFLDSGLRTVIVATMANKLGEEMVGAEIDRAFIDSLSPDIDVNGENGEYHTFCFDGPIFTYPVPFRIGGVFTQSFDVKLDSGEIEEYACCFADLCKA